MSDRTDPARLPRRDEWTQLSSTLLLDRWPWLRVYADDVELPNGHRIDGFLRIEGREHTQVFAVTDDEHLLLIRQYKYGPGRMVLQLPAGYLDDGETPEAGARRELLEETGYAARSWEPLGRLSVDGNRGFGAGHYFLARGAYPVQDPDPGEDEQVSTVRVPLRDVPTLLGSGAFGEAGPVAVCALALIRLGLVR